MCKIAYLFLCKGFKILKLIYMSLLFSEDFSDEQSCIQYFEKIRCPERFSPPCPDIQGLQMQRKHVQMPEY